jgi:hypothetical protein
MQKPRHLPGRGRTALTAVLAFNDDRPRHELGDTEESVRSQVSHSTSAFPHSEGEAELPSLNLQAPGLIMRSHQEAPAAGAADWPDHRPPVMAHRTQHRVRSVGHKLP